MHESFAMTKNDQFSEFRARNTAQVATSRFFAGTSGDAICDQSGATVIDFTSGYGVTNAGWQREKVISVIEKSVRQRSFAPPWMPTSEAVLLSRSLLETAAGFSGKCVRATGGGDANEQILKAVLAERPGKILCLERAYHGGSLATLALSDAERFGLPSPGFVARQPRVPAPYCFRCPWRQRYPTCGLSCAQAVDHALRQDAGIVGFIVEPVIGSGGIIVPPPEYLPMVAGSCREHGVRLILDEVMTGFGRTGHMLCANTLPLQPDAIALGKGLGGGCVPVGAALLNNGLAKALERYEDTSSTFAWTPLACIAAQANLELIHDEGLAERAGTMGAKLREQLHAVFAKHVPDHLGEIRGCGFMIGIELVRDRDSLAPAPEMVRRLALTCLKRGLMLAPSWDWTTLVVLPPLNIAESTLDEAVAIVAESLRETVGRR